MKRNKIFLSLIISIVLIAGLGLCACKKPNEQPSTESYVQQLNYEESTERINNPHQGFYQPVYVRITEKGVAYDKNIIKTNTQLFHLRIDISAFSGAVNGTGDKEFTQSALNGLDELLAYIKSNDKNAVVRFVYDPELSGNKDKEPELQMILRHIEQACEVIDNYKSTVTAIEAGLIGPWGEMHSSAVANAKYITPIVDALLSHTEVIPVLVRTPKMIYDYLGITLKDIDNYSIDANQKAYRLGLYNDGYLGSNTDLGTYNDRERETKFLSRQTAHLPYGGEVVEPESSLHNIEKCLPEMNLLNLSYLNTIWNGKVIEKWEKSFYTSACGTDEKYYGKTAFEYIENHLGYRFVLTESVFRYSENSDKLQVELKLKNVGFGNLNRQKHAKIILTDKDGGTVFTQAVRDFSGEDRFDCSLDLNLPSGNYEVYLCLYEDETESGPLYCLQFANDGLWNKELKANKIGNVQIGENR